MHHITHECRPLACPHSCISTFYPKHIYILGCKEPYIILIELQIYSSGSESHISTKEPYTSGKEPDISGKEPDISAKEPGISAKEPRIILTEL